MLKQLASESDKSTVGTFEYGIHWELEITEFTVPISARCVETDRFGTVANFTSLVRVRQLLFVGYKLFFEGLPAWNTELIAGLALCSTSFCYYHPQ